MRAAAVFLIAILTIALLVPIVSAKGQNFGEEILLEQKKTNSHAAFVEARRRVAAVRENNSNELRLNKLKTLDRLPPEIAGVTALKQLNLNGTQVSDLSPLADLTALKRLSLRESQVADLSPLIGLATLNLLTLQDGTTLVGRTKVQAWLYENAR